jgi:hypothetical protein
MSRAPATLSPNRRRALELLAGCPQEGCTKAVMWRTGSASSRWSSLVRSATQRVVAGNRTIEAATVRTTEAGCLRRK